MHKMNKPLLSAFKVNSIKVISNFINSSAPCHVIKLDMGKQQKIMRKIMHRVQNGKKMTPVPTAKTLSKTDGEDARMGRRRVSVLNKLFMSHITDLMTTGEIAEMVKGKQLEISQVKVAPNFGTIYILWLAKGDPEEKETEIILQKVAGMLRHELSQLKVIGVVPLLQFVKDTQLAKLHEVEHLLAIADFGEDFEPTLASKILKEELTLKTKLSSKIADKIKELEKKEDEKYQAEEEEIIEEPMPPMRHDVFGLDRNRMMIKLENTNSKTRSDVKYRIAQEDEDESFMTPMEQNIKFSKFIKEREITRRSIERNLRRQKNSGEHEEIVELERKKYFADDIIDDINNQDFDDVLDDFTTRKRK